MLSMLLFTCSSRGPCGHRLYNKQCVGWLVVVLVIIVLNLAIFFRQSQTGRIFMYTLDGIRACSLISNEIITKKITSLGFY